MTTEKQNYHYKEINLKNIKISKSDSELLNHYTIEESSEALKNLSLINIFVGTNNSGKSRFLRTLFHASDFNCQFNGESMVHYSKILQNYLDELKNLIIHYKINTVSSYNEAQTPEQIIDSVMPYHLEFSHFIREPYLNTRDQFQLIDLAKKSFSSANINQSFQAFRGKGNLRYGNSQEQFSVNLQQTVSNFISQLTEQGKDLPNHKNSPIRKMYIPIMRGLRKFAESDKISRSISEEYFKFSNDEHKNEFLRNSFFNGFNIYDDLSKKLLDSSISRRKVMEYENFLSKEFFNGLEIQISPNTDDQTIHIKIGEQRDLPIYSLGDGLQTIILVTYNGFFNEENTTFFIEEPEVYLHPGLQRTLVESILRHPILRRHQWFFTTHSNHFLDFTLDYSQISVFNFKANLEGKFQVSYMNKADQSVLYNMGVKPSSVFRTNCIIWVEGITDRKYLREMLHKYMASLLEDEIRYKEDVHFTFVELGGANYVHFNLEKENKEKLINVQWIADKSFLLLDGDNNKGDRLKNFDNLAEDAKFMLSQKEIENIIPQEVVVHVVEKMIKKSKCIDDKDGTVSNLNYIQFAEYSQKDIKIGEYLDSKLKLSKPYFNTASGTINQKTEFCDLAVEFMSDSLNNWSLNSVSKELAQKVYQFIKAANN